ncbi:hypothetical protein [Metallibacterium scheffleri]|uniref:Uncharacterized protein n=1 Tax=Metallibacterium scheffleri TaxID=993689 RepID=A0A4S3KE35_9GAMM|nr:hypothetical protein [Metallibacterium scheffleri]THD06772.1 hypothetical protein B1806_15700 [Metallibacterium scheffleri]
MATKTKTTGRPIIGRRYRMPPPYCIGAAYTVTVDAFDQRRGLIAMHCDQGREFRCTRSQWRGIRPTPID